MFDPEVFAYVEYLEILSKLVYLALTVDTNVKRIVFHTKSLPKLKTLKLNGMVTGLPIH